MKIDIDQLLHQGVTAQKEGKLEEAEKSYKKAIEIKPDFVEAYNNLGVVLKELSKFDEAELSYKKAIEINPNHISSHYNLGVMFDQLGDYQKSIDCLSNVLKIDPNSAVNHNNLGIMLQKLGRFDEAKVSYKKSIKLKPDFKEAKKNLSSELDELIRLDKIIALNPSIDKALIRKSKTLVSSNRQFSSPKLLEYEEFYREGMGTENIGSFLRALVQMVRPNRILEIGAGYTTPFLLEAAVNNEKIYNDGNLKESYFENYNYSPKLIVIDDMSLGELKKKIGFDDLLASKYIDFIEGKFQDKSDMLFNKYGKFDFVWFDCGGESEYKIFMDKYWDMCSGYVLFHFTYSDGEPNRNHKIVLDKIKDNTSIFDIVEPHKKRQGSITMIKKNS